VLDQSLVNSNDVEIIVVDDGSSDSSAQQVELVLQQQPHRNITLFRQANAGVSVARNKGVELAQHDLIAFLDADDSYTPIFLQTITSLKKDYPLCRFFGTAYNFINLNAGTKRKARVTGLNSKTKNQYLDDFFIAAANGDLPFCASSICIDKSLFHEVGGFPEGENMGEDQSLYCEVALKEPMAISPTACTNYFLEVEGSLMQTVKSISEMPFSQRLQSASNASTVSSRERVSIQKYIAGHLLDLVRRNLINGNLDASKKQLKDPRIKMKSLKWFYWYGKTHYRLALSK
jgi:glycosyltransferase involved in cell wall biosynthesis